MVSVLPVVTQGVPVAVSPAETPTVPKAGT